MSAAISFGPSFSVPPIVIANKDTRNGGDGGWLRRCFLSAAQYAPVFDEDVYQDSERDHTNENYSFLAIENNNVQTLDHFELRYPETASACSPGDVVLKACAKIPAVQHLYQVSFCHTYSKCRLELQSSDFHGGQTTLSFGPSTSGPLVLGNFERFTQRLCRLLQNGQPDAPVQLIS